MACDDRTPYKIYGVRVRVRVRSHAIHVKACVLYIGFVELPAEIHLSASWNEDPEKTPLGLKIYTL